MSTHAVHPKGFASLLTTFSFVVMSLSGLLLFIVPQGRIADWTDWRMLGLSKSQWGDMHITTSLLFLAAGAWHIALNWRTLLNYFTARRDSALMMRRELAVSAALALVFVVGATFKLPPVSYVLDLNDAIKQAWIVDRDHEPPIGHAELLTVPVFARRLQMDPQAVATTLAANGIRYQETESLAVIARRHGRTPAHLYQMLRPLEGGAQPAAPAPAAAADTTPATHATPAPNAGANPVETMDAAATPSPPPPATPARSTTPTTAATTSISATPATPTTPMSPAKAAPAVPGAAVVPSQPPAPAVYTDALVEEKFEGRGMGRKTLGALAGEIGFDLGRAQARLATRGWSVGADESLKDAAARLGTAPMELLKVALAGEPVRP
jgi:hypothetical protein